MANQKKPRKAKTPAPENETKADKFKRLGTARLSKALKTIKLIGNLSGAGYDYDDDQIKKIEDALSGQVTATMQKFKDAAYDEAPSVQL